MQNRKRDFLLKMFLMLFLVLVFVWSLSNAENIPVAGWIKSNLHNLKMQLAFYPMSSILLFVVIHFASSTMCIPGGCTFLNILSGAVFGFSQGIVIVYSITFLSATFGYFLGRRLKLDFLPLHWQNKVDPVKVFVRNAGPMLLVLLRLSPLLPFSLLNILCGHLRIQYKTFIISTTLGVFFDVVLLNSIGAVLNGESTMIMQQRGWLGAGILFLFFAHLCVKIFQFKMIPEKYVENK